jgi:hypothetical protein
MPEGGLFKNVKFWSVLLIIVGIVLIVLPMLTMPQEIVHRDNLNEANNHSTQARLVLEPGDYEVWMTETFWSWFNLDQPLVFVNTSTGVPIHVNSIVEGDTRKFDGNDCKLFATFEIETRDTYDVTIEGSFLTASFPWGNSLYVAEARAPAYAALQWSGALLLILGLVVLSVIGLQRLLKGIDKGLKDRPPQYQQPYPPAYPPHYPPQHPSQQQPPPGYPQHPPPQHPPPPPQGGYAPPPGQQDTRHRPPQ